MKKLYVFAALGIISTALTYCSSTKKAARTAAAAKSSYATTVAPVVAASCSPCHIPSKGGNKKAYDNYANVKSDIDEILRRIELNPGEKGFMPFRRSTKLAADTIAIFKKFKDDGLLEN